jgi:hypothetical protein
VLELVELREIDVARAILKQTGAMIVLRDENSERWLKLDHILSRGSFDPREVYPGGSKEKRREEIAEGKNFRYDALRSPFMFILFLIYYFERNAFLLGDLFFSLFFLRLVPYLTRASSLKRSHSCTARTVTFTFGPSSQVPANDW